MDENTIAEHSWIIIVMTVIVAFLAFAPVLSDMLIDYAHEIISAHFQ